MRKYYAAQLSTLNTSLIQMGALCEDAISSAIQGFLENDPEIAKKVSDIEMEIDQFERDIERLCMRLLLMQQPVATDLRVVSSALKMISDLERIGDQAYDIADITKKQFVSGLRRKAGHQGNGKSDNWDGNRQRRLLCQTGSRTC